MNTSLLVKLLVGCAAGSLTIWLSTKTWTHEKVYVYVKTSKTTENLSGLDINDGEFKNYQCKIENLIFNCKITQLKELGNNKKHFNSNHFYDSFEDQKLQLREDDNIYRIEMSSNELDWSKEQDFSNKTIKALPYGVSDKIMATSTPLFVLNKDGKKIGKTEYFIGKAKSSLDEKTTISNYECAWKTGDVDPAAKDKASCTVTQFDSNEIAASDDTKDHSELTFTNTAATKIEQYKHYLIKFTDTNYPLQTYDQSLIVFYDKTNMPKEVEFSKIKPSFLVKDNLLVVEVPQQ